MTCWNHQNVQVTKQGAWDGTFAWRNWIRLASWLLCWPIMACSGFSACCDLARFIWSLVCFVTYGHQLDPWSCHIIATRFPKCIANEGLTWLPHFVRCLQSFGQMSNRWPWGKAQYLQLTVQYQFSNSLVTGQDSTRRNYQHYLTSRHLTTNRITSSPPATNHIKTGHHITTMERLKARSLKQLCLGIAVVGHPVHIL